MDLLIAPHKASALLPELDLNGLERAADTYFPGNAGVSDDDCAALSAAFYDGLDLGGRGAIWRDGDVRSLERAIPSALQAVGRVPGRRPRPHRLLVVGCGDGRLLTMMATTALLYGVQELILNDLHPFHVEAAESVLVSAGLTRRGLRVRLLPGDITSVAAEAKVDVAVSWFFVDAELISLASVAALRAKRRTYRMAMARCLGPGGVLIMDRPDASTGFYAAVRRATHQVLAARGLMRGEEGNLDLAWIPGGPQPYHCRYVPAHGAHRRAMQAAGFQGLDDRVQTAEPSTTAGLTRRKIVELWQVAQPRAPAGQVVMADLPRLGAATAAA